MNLKFRYWDDEKNKMIGPYDFDRWEMVDPDSLMQFTGLHDSQGNEIYLYDILMDGDGNYRRVGFQSGAFVLYDSENDDYWDVLGGEHVYLMEIRGNIYENPGLIGE